MQALIIIFAGILGIIIGSFLNVVILRINTGKGLGGRSMCLSCGKTLHWHELIPIFSYFFQKGACKKCRSAISMQYPLVEIATGALFAGAAAKFAHLALQGSYASFALTLLFWFVMISIAVVISVYDIRHKIIYIPLLIAFLILCLLGGLFGGMSGLHFIIPSGGLSIIPQVIAAIVVPLPFFLIWLASGGRLMGLGDIEIMIGMGFLLGTVSGFSAVVVSFWIGTAIVCLLVLARNFAKKRMPLDRAIAFGPFLFAGLYAVGVLGWDVFAIILGLR